MKRLLLGLFLINSFALQAESKDAVCQNGQEKAFYYRSQPRTQMGPRYSCERVKRVRTCLDGQWSNTKPACGTSDSGGCSDFWLDQLSDDSFTYETCVD